MTKALNNNEEQWSTRGQTDNRQVDNRKRGHVNAIVDSIDFHKPRWTTSASFKALSFPIPRTLILPISFHYQTNNFFRCLIFLRSHYWFYTCQQWQNTACEHTTAFQLIFNWIVFEFIDLLRKDNRFTENTVLILS